MSGKRVAGIGLALIGGLGFLGLLQEGTLACLPIFLFFLGLVMFIFPNIPLTSRSKPYRASNPRTPVTTTPPSERRIREVQTLLQSMLTQELLDIWSENDRVKWSDEAFGAVYRELRRREVTPPPIGGSTRKLQNPE